MKELVFRLTKKDFIIQSLKGSGPGGQHRNKRETGIRIVHPDSGAVGVATDSKSQRVNKKNALERLVATKEFQSWKKLKVGEILRDGWTVEQEVERQMSPRNLRIEIKEKGRWVEDNTD